MRLPMDDEEKSGLSPSVVMTTILVSVFVLLVLVVVWVINVMPKEQTAKKPVESAAEMIKDAETEELVLVDKDFSPDQFDFWDLYPEVTKEPVMQEEVTESVEVHDPSTDGKHTMVMNRSGEAEWVLISPYLPKHEYDFTKLVCQDGLMKYYEDGRQVSFEGVDVSKYQDYIDFPRLKKAGIDFVMIRLGARGYGTGQLLVDDYYTENMKRAGDAGLEIGVYFTSQAITEEEAVEEANLVIEHLKDYQISYPVAIDMGYVENDTARIEELSKADKTKVIRKFLDTIQAAGYLPMIRGDKEWFIKSIDLSKLTDYDMWLTQEKDIPDYPYKFTMWQYSTSTIVDGISGQANVNISFVDYSEK